MIFKSEMNMKYLLIILASLYLSENGLTATIESQDRFPVETRFSFRNEAGNQASHIFENPLPNNADCVCKNGECVKEDGEVFCRCNLGFGNYTRSYCKVCECGSDSNCYWLRTGWLQLSKVCLCKPGYKEQNGTCVGPCSKNPCKNGGTCKDVENGYECVCTPNYTGKDCTKKDPCIHNPCKNNGTCIVDGEKFKCSCVGPWRGNLCEHDIATSTIVTAHSPSLMTTILTSTALSCSCGENSKSCSYNWYGEKICDCFPGYAVREDYCFDCNCGPYGSCKFVNGLKKCICNPFTVDMNGVCVDASTSSSKGTTDSIITTTIISTSSTERDCTCGHSTKTCRYNALDEKECTCYSGYAVNQGYCEECNCGPYGSCRFENGNKLCNCKPFTVEKRGFCVAIESSTTEKTTTRISTTPTPRYCTCGHSTKTCRYNALDEKECTCYSGHAVNQGHCEECNCGPYGSCRFENGNKLCNCKPFTVEKRGFCVAIESSTTEKITTRISTTPTPTPRSCSCGENSKSCSYNWYGEKICECFPGYSVKDGYCLECNCGPYGTCSFRYGRKRCNCEPSAVEKQGVCVVMESTTTEKTTTRMPTSLPPTTRSCYCGENSKSCSYNWYGEKICECFPGYAVKEDYCFECNCGPYGSCKFVNGRKKCSCAPFTVEIKGVCVEVGTSSTKGTTDFISTSTMAASTIRVCDCGMNALSCFYRRNGDKVCNCDFGYVQTSGYCSAICNEEKCVHGKCEIIGNGFKCRCNEGFTGPRCADKTQAISDKQNLWMALQFTITFAIFLLLSGMFCFMGRLLRRSFKK